MRLVKKTEVSTLSRVINMIVAILLAILTTSGFLLMIGHNPLSIYPAMFMAIFGSSFRLMTLIKYIVPLIIVSLGISVAFKMRFWNIGGEGQLIMGAIFASYFALFHDYLPAPVLLPLMAVAAIFGGGLYGLLAAVLKAYFHTNETIVTLMLNYIAFQFLTYLQYVAWKEDKFPIIPTFKANALLPSYQGISSAVFIALAVIIFSYTMLNKSKLGFEIKVVGESDKTAEYIGIDLKKISLLMMFISGGIIGLAGFTQVAGNIKTLSTGVTLGVGFTGVVIAWIAKLDEGWIIFASVLFACLVQAVGALESLFQIPPYSVDVIQAIVLFFVLGCDFFNEYSIKRGGKI